MELMEPELGTDIEVSVVGLDGETFKAGSNRKQLQVDGMMVKYGEMMWNDSYI